MLSLSLQVAIAAASAASVAALPPHDARTSLLARQSNDQPIKVTDYSAYPDPARWSQAAYCNVQSGDNVNNANVIKTFGDGSDTPYAYVAWHEASNRVVVSHEGTDPSKFQSIENDADFALAPLDSRLNGCLDGASQLHHGFQDTWTHTADDILSTVSDQLSQHQGASVLVTGHSLGAAIASLDHAYLTCKLSGTTVKAIVFGQPRTGNLAFANSVPAYEHFNNGDDLVPRVPPRADDISSANDGYWHAAGELWQKAADEVSSLVSCPGQENSNCIDGQGTVNIIDHLGVYAGVTIGGTPDC